METKFDKLRTYQENRHESSKEKATRRKKKSAKAEGPTVTGFESQGMIKTSMSDLPKDKWEKIFGKKNTKTKSNKKTRRYYKQDHKD